MDRYNEYSAEQLALDKDFQNWVLSPDAHADKMWKDWIGMNPQKQRVVDTAIQLIQAAGLSGDPEANAAYLEGWSKIQNTAPQAVFTVSRRKFLGYAAMAATLVGILVMVYYWRAESGNFSEFKTAFSEVKEIQLPDGTKVTLNANSTLRIPNDLNQNAVREVSLNGEGFFAVTHTNNDKPFIVHTRDNANIHVIGTTFNVSTRKNRISVYLQTGKVKFSTLSGDLVMEPGQMAEYVAGKQINVMTATEDAVAWKDALYILNDTPLSEIIADVKDTYGKEVVVSDTALYHRRVTTKLPANDLKVLLEVLSQTLELDVKEENNRILIKQR